MNFLFKKAFQFSNQSLLSSVWEWQDLRSNHCCVLPGRAQTWASPEHPTPIHLTVNCSSLSRGTPQINPLLHKTKPSVFLCLSPGIIWLLLSYRKQAHNTLRLNAAGNQSFCCVCKQNLGATWSHMSRPLKFLISPHSLAPMKRVPHHLEAVTEHKNHRDLPLVDQQKSWCPFQKQK